MNQSLEVRPPRIGFGGDREIALQVLQFLIEGQCIPECLVTASGEGATHADALRHCYERAGGRTVLEAHSFIHPDCLGLLESMELDFLILVHLQNKIPTAILRLPKHGVLNLHPAYLPDNRGWHTPSWAILNQSRFGATLHFMNECIDEGDIVHQREIKIEPSDTAHSLYQKGLALEYEVFREAWPSLAANRYSRKQQQESTLRTHKKSDLAASGIQKIDLEEQVSAGELIRRLRALTTDRIAEACYFDEHGERYRIQVSLHPDPDQTAQLKIARATD